MLSVREQLEQKFSVPKTFVFHSAREHRFDYVVNQQIKDRIRTYCQNYERAPYDRNAMFDPRFSIDDFLYFWKEANTPDYEKMYNLDQFGVCNVVYSAQFSPCNTFMYFDITLNHPRNVINYMGIYAFLQYAVNDNYISLARKLSLHDNGPLPPFRHIRVILEDTTGNVMRIPTGIVWSSFSAEAFQSFSKHFEPVGQVAQNVFMSVQELPFPVDTIVSLDVDVPAFEYTHMADDNAPAPADFPVRVVPFLPTAMDIPPNMGSDDESSDEDDA
jgi:hypothetical protein